MSSLRAFVEQQQQQQPAAGGTSALRSFIEQQPAVNSVRTMSIAPDGGGLTEVAKNVPAPPPSVASDVVKSAASGVAGGMINLAGLPGDLQSGMRWMLKQAGVDLPDNAPLPSISIAGIPASSMSSDAIRQGVERVAGPLYEPKTTAGEYAQTVGEFAPAAIGGAPSVLGKVAQAVVPALASETAGQATEGTDFEPYARAAGAVAGGVAPSLAARAVTPLPVNPQRGAAVQALRAEGVQPTAGQATGSKALKYAESELGGGATARTLERQSDQFTRAVLRRAGEHADRATPEVIDRAFNRIGGQFNRLSANNQIVPSTYGRLMQSLRAVSDEYTDVVPAAGQARIIERTLQDIAGRIQSGQPIPGNVYQSFRSRFDRLARGARDDPQLSEALYGIRNSLDDAMEQSLQATGRTADIAAWQEARQQYRNLLVIERAATGAGEEAAMGAISPAKLRQADVGQNRRRHVRGQSDFSELARSGQAVMSPMPQSGTAPRSWMRNVPAMIAGGALGGATAGTVGATIGAAVGPMVAGRALMSRPVQGYLQNQLVPGGNVGNALARAPINALLTRP